MNEQGEVRFSATIMLFSQKKLVMRYRSALYASDYGEAEKRFKAQARSEYPKCGVKVAKLRVAE